MSTEPPPGGRRGRAGRKAQPREVARLVGLGLVAVLFLAFVVDNSQTVRVSFVVWHANLRLIWVLLLSALAGAVADHLFFKWRRRER